MCEFNPENRVVGELWSSSSTQECHYDYYSTLWSGLPSNYQELFIHENGLVDKMNISRYLRIIGNVEYVLLYQIMVVVLRNVHGLSSCPQIGDLLLSMGFKKVLEVWN